MTYAADRTQIHLKHQKTRVEVGGLHLGVWSERYHRHIMSNLSTGRHQHR